MIELVTLGRASIRQDRVELGELAAHRQKFALLCYLAIEGPVGRDGLLEMFWPGVGSNARHLLSAALYSVKKKLGEEVVTAAGDQLAVPAELVKLDVHDMEAASQGKRWDEVVRLYEGPFLDHFYLPGMPAFDEWQSRTRAWVGNLARTAFREVIAFRAGRGDLGGALDVAGRWAKVESMEDDAQHALIALLAMTGNRAAALAHYHAYRSHLEREFDFEPLEETVQMVEAIQAGGLPNDPLLYGQPTGEPAPTIDVVPETLQKGQEARPELSAASVQPADIDGLVKSELEPKLRIERKLAETSAARVYLAHDPELNRRLALKVFSPAVADDRRARLRFEREVQAVASLNHPNIAALHWAGALSNGLPYFVMQYVEGPTLAEKLRLEGPLTNEHARRLLSQLASALAAAHRRGIVHRDVRLANVLCDEEAGRCLLTDFGIAAILTSAQIQPLRITESGELVGDPAWMSPEQLKTGRVSERSDIYSLGLLGYQLLAEQSPYQAATRQELYAAHVQQEPRELTSLRADVDRDLADIVQRCLDKDPARRPSAAFVARALAAPRPAPPVKQQASGWFERLVERRVPHWLAAYLAGGWGLVELVALLEGRDVLGPPAVDLSLLSYFLGAPVVFVLAWYHGRSGPQRVMRLEYWLLGAVLAIWLTLLVFYLVP